MRKAKAAPNDGMQSKRDDAYKRAGAKDAAKFEKARKIRIMLCAKFTVHSTSGQEEGANG
jgi:hypothetical protein